MSDIVLSTDGLDLRRFWQLSRPEQLERMEHDAIALTLYECAMRKADAFLRAQQKPKEVAK